MIRFFSVVVGACLGGVASFALLWPAPSAEPAGRSWPTLGGTPQRNMVNTVEKNLAAEWSVKEGEQKNIKWVAELGTTSYGGPVLAGGKIFVGTNNEKPRDPKLKGQDKGIVMCFREADGQFLWQAVHDKLPEPNENDWPQTGVVSTPTVEGDRLYYVGNRCEIVCLDTEGFLDGKNDGVQDEKLTGKHDADVVWRLDMIKDLGVYPCYIALSSPLVVGDLLYVVTGNGVIPNDPMNKLPAPQAPSFIAVNKKTGKVVWQDNSPGDKIMEGQWTQPAYAEVGGKGQVIFPGGDGWLYSFAPADGKLIWKFDANPKDAVYKLGGRGTKNYFLATPVVHDNKVTIGVGQNPDYGTGVGHLWCVDLTKTGDVSAEIVEDGKTKPNPNSAVVWHFGGMAEKGAERDFLFGRTLSTCAIHDGLLYVAELDGFLHCVDAKTGKPHWQHDMKASVYAPPVWIDGKVYLGNDDGDVYVFAHGKAKKQLVKVEMERPVRNAVVAVNGVLYVMTDSHLYAIAGK